METFWYTVVTLMLALYAVLDGFDFGVGILYPLLGRSEAGRAVMHDAIGPVWNGNEVWLIGAAGVLFFAFPKAYAAGFSGFYLALILVLWLLMFRGLALELRSHVDHPLWRQLCDVIFSGASLLLAFVFGAALGNLIRGVPLDREGYFFVALWTDFSTGPEPGILDWFTVLMGMASVVILALHGANYLALKTEGDLYARAVATAALLGWVTLGAAVLVGLGITVVQPTLPSTTPLTRWATSFPLAEQLPLSSCSCCDEDTTTLPHSRLRACSSLHCSEVSPGGAIPTS